MNSYKTHLSSRATDDSACGTFEPRHTTNETHSVTCEACKRTRRYDACVRRDINDIDRAYLKAVLAGEDPDDAKYDAWKDGDKR